MWVLLLLLVSHCFAEDLSGVSISWATMQKAERYRLWIYRDADLQDPVIDEEISRTTQTPRQTHFVNGIPAGTYFAVVEGFKKGNAKSVGKTAPFQVVVADSMVITGNRYGLAPPEPLAPAAGTKLAPGMRITFRWTDVKRATGYRLRFWKVDGKTPTLLWTTIVPHNWIEIYDLPPSSYRALRPGQYRWHIASVLHSNDGYTVVGNEKISFFEVNEAAALQDFNSAVRLSTEIGRYYYSGFSGESGERVFTHGLRTAAAVDWEHFFQSLWGISARGQIDRLFSSGPPHPSITLLQGEVAGLYRHVVNTHFLKDGSLRPGWVLTGVLGLRVQDIFEMLNSSTEKTPMAVGPSYGFDAANRFSDRWKFVFGVRGFLPVYMTRDGESGQQIESTSLKLLNFKAKADIAHYINSGWNVFLGLEASTQRYEFKRGFVDSNIHYRTLGTRIGTEFNF